MNIRNSTRFVPIRLCVPFGLFVAGLEGQWIGMAEALMPIKIFANKIEECHQILNLAFI